MLPNFRKSLLQLDNAAVDVHEAMLAAIIRNAADSSACKHMSRKPGGE